ncbi:MAG: DUF3516 domain-containing protein, partial [Planctomycetes bacterium]|nr:DUF3516 domain-containing protein [Planctomycetota bacterium]
MARRADRADEPGNKKRRFVRKNPPRRGFVAWNRETFERLVESPPEMLSSRFSVSHGMVVSVLQREGGSFEQAWMIVRAMVGLGAPGEFEMDATDKYGAFVFMGLVLIAQWRYRDSSYEELA